MLSRRRSLRAPEPYCAEAPHRLLQMRVGTPFGVRVETLSVPMPLSAQHIVLQPSNGFAADGVCVRSWGAATCAVVPFMDVSHTTNNSSDDDVDVGYDDNPFDASNDTNLNFNDNNDEVGGKRKRVSALCESGQKRVWACNDSASWFIDMTDVRPDHVGYIWLLPMGDYVARRVHGQEELAHTPHDFRIENTCGACILDESFDREWMKPHMLRLLDGPAAASSSTPSLIATMAGTFAPCVRRTMQVDYRGVRSVAAMTAEWRLLAGRPAVRTQVYMLVLKANLGASVLIVDHGSIPDGLTGVGAEIARDGCGICFLAERMSRWCDDFTQHVDVCLTLQLRGLAWTKLFPDVCEPLRHARTCMYVSRRGGLMLRLLFRRNTPWGPDDEAAVVRDCDRLLAFMRAILAGKSPAE